MITREIVSETMQSISIVLIAEALVIAFFICVAIMLAGLKTGAV